MSLENYGIYNDLSPKLREELEQKVEAFGKSVRYRFDIAKPNPDPSKYNGDTVYPNMYTLDPVRFSIQDPYETREGKSKTKTIALVDDASIKDDGNPERLLKVRVSGAERAVLKLNIQDKREDFYMAMLLEMHPKLNGGKFADKNAYKILHRIDEEAAARGARTERSERLKALNVAQGMSDEELINFSDAMQWDSTESVEVLRNQVEELADNNPVYFNDFVMGKTIEYQSLIKQAVDRDLISFDHAEYKFVWAGNQQVITVLSPTSGKSEVQKLSDWMQTSGNKGDDFYKKLKSLVKSGKKEKSAE
jgi:hypothetical protein